MIILLTTIFWLLGGQYGSAWRKYGIMAVVIAIIAINVSRGTNILNYSVLPVFCASLFLGYGEKSWLMKKLKNETLVRIFDAIIIALPLLITCFLHNKGFINYIVIVLSLLLAFQIRGGGIKIGNKDLLFVDVARGVAVGVSLTNAI